MPALDFDQIRRLLPHAWPFVLIDRVDELVPRVSAVAVKNVSGAEPWIPGHFPQRTILPGVLVIEAAAQTACVMLLAGGGAAADTLWALGRVDKFQLLGAVRPGDQLVIRANAMKILSDGAIVEVECEVGGVATARGRLLFGAFPAPPAADPERGP